MGDALKVHVKEINLPLIIALPDILTHLDTDFMTILNGGQEQA